MAELILPTINLIMDCVNKYNDFCAFKDECETFRRSLGNVVDVLTDMEKQLARSSGRSSMSSSGRSLASSGGGATNTKLRRPMELLQSATADGGEVLKKCCAKRMLLAFVFSRQLMGMLNKAKADIEEAMRLLQVSSVNIQVSTRRMMDTVTERLAELDKKIGPGIASGPNEVAELVRAEMKLNRASHGTSVAEALSEALVKMGVVNSPQDCAEQFADLQREADTIRRAKVIYDEEMLEAVKALTAPRDDDAAASQRQGSEATASAVEQCMVCPISGEIMHDPVSVLESGITYDHESLCTSLLLYPDLEPVTGQRFDHPLHYAPNIAVRNLVTAQYGDSHYQKYDDGEFKIQYEAKWEERLNPPTPVVLVKDSGNSANEGGTDNSWTGFDTWSAFTEPTSATSGVASSRDVSSGQLMDSFGAISGGASDGSVGSNEKFSSPDATLIQDSMLSSDDNAADEEGKAGEEGAATKLKKKPHTYWSSRKHWWPIAGDENADDEAGKEGAATKLKEKLREYWSSRKFRWLIAGAVTVLLVVIVAASAAAASKRTPSLVEAFHATLPQDTIERIQESDSPQYRAYEWVTKSDLIPEQDETDRNRAVFRMKQRFALATFCYSVAGLESWVDWTASECEWGTYPEQIKCDSGSQVVALATATGTGGTLPPEIGLLTDLTRLSLADNGLASSIPTELGLLAALTYLDLGSDYTSNELTSSIPTELGRLQALEYLDLDSNGLTSSIPTELGLLVALTRLDLGQNELRSSIPTELRRLSNLYTLDLSSNELSGTFPSDLCEVPSIDVDCVDISCSCCGCST